MKKGVYGIFKLLNISYKKHMKFKKTPGKKEMKDEKFANKFIDRTIREIQENQDEWRALTGGEELEHYFVETSKKELTKLTKCKQLINENNVFVLVVIKDGYIICIK